MQKRVRQWPKGPFPPKYRWPQVQERLRVGVDAGRLARAEALLCARGLTRFDEALDPFWRRFALLAREPTEAPWRALSAEVAEQADSFACRYLVSALESEQTRGAPPLLCVVPSPDPIDALLTVGVAGPAQGIGSSTLVRFVVALRSFASFELEALGETAWRMAIRCRDDESEERVAMRVLEILPSALREGTTPQDVRARLAAGRLDLDWAEPPSLR